MAIWPADFPNLKSKQVLCRAARAAIDLAGMELAKRQLTTYIVKPRD